MKNILIFCMTVLFYSCASSQGFTALDSAGGTEIRENGKKVLFYQFQPKSINGQYERAGYIHPLYSMKETVLTEDHPVDHLHHHGIFWAWHQIVLNGKQVADSWTSEHISWKPIKMTVKKDRDKLVINAKLIWNVQASPSDKIIPVISEFTKITVFKSTARYRILDFDIKLTALTNDLRIGGSSDVKGYGGFSLRFKLPADISFHSRDSSVTPINEQILAGPWMNFSGSFDGESSPKAGVAVFCPTTEPGNKQPWILRSSESMQNIVFPGNDPVALTKDGKTFNYRLVIQNEELGNDELQAMYQQYILSSHH